MARLDELGQPFIEDLGDVDEFAIEDTLRLTPSERLRRHESALKSILQLRAVGEKYYGRSFDADSTETVAEGDGTDATPR